MSLPGFPQMQSRNDEGHKELYEAKYRGPVGQRGRLAVWHREVLKTLEGLDGNECAGGGVRQWSSRDMTPLESAVSAEPVGRCRENGLRGNCADVGKDVPYEDKFEIGVSVEVIEGALDSTTF